MYFLNFWNPGVDLSRLSDIFGNLFDVFSDIANMFSNFWEACPSWLVPIGICYMTLSMVYLFVGRG